jgi:hypothetical protein
VEAVDRAGPHPDLEAREVLAQRDVERERVDRHATAAARREARRGERARGDDGLRAARREQPEHARGAGQRSEPPLHGSVLGQVKALVIPRL